MRRLSPPISAPPPRAPTVQPGAVDDAIEAIEKALTRLKAVHTSQREHNWETYARRLRSRVQAQRTELRLINRKIHSLRGDVHYAQEKAEESDQKRCDEVNALQERVYELERDRDVVVEGLSRLKPLLRQGKVDEVTEAIDWLRRSPAFRETDAPKETP